MDQDQQAHRRSEIGEAICALGQGVADSIIGMAVDCSLGTSPERREVTFQTTPTADASATLLLYDAEDRFRIALTAASAAGGTVHALGGSAHIAERRTTPGRAVMLVIACVL